MNDSNRKSSLSTKAYQEILNLIISMRLKPGMQVNTEELEHGLSIGKTPVREALLRLANEGLLTSVQGRGFFVRHVSLEDVKSLFETVMILERPGVSLAARRITTPEILELSRVNEELGKAMSQGQFLEVTILNSQFHRIIYESVNNTFLTASLCNLDSQYRRLAYLCFSKEANANDLDQHFAKVLAGHNELIDAFEKRDEAAAVEAITHHVHLFNSRVSLYLYPPVPTYEGIIDSLPMESGKNANHR